MGVAAISALQLARATTHTHKPINRHAATLICGRHLISFLVSKLLYDLCPTHTNLPACSLKYTQEKITAGGGKGRMVVNRMSLRLTAQIARFTFRLLFIWAPFDAWWWNDGCQVERTCAIKDFEKSQLCSSSNRRVFYSGCENHSHKDKNSFPL